MLKYLFDLNKCVAVVTPMTWTFLATFREFREMLLDQFSWPMFALLGKQAFSSISGEVVQTALLI
jgi:hypothetical protein